MQEDHFPQLAKLLWVMDCLRDPDTGCPWDKEQSFETIVPYTIEEAYEVADAILHQDMEAIKDELGDLLFQVVFYAHLGKEQAAFDFEAVAGQVADKLIRRHPHVFGDSKIETEQQLNNTWEAIKKKEREDNGKAGDSSILAHIPAGMAPTQKAVKLQKRCAKIGFDWEYKQQVADKIHEEVHEVLEAASSPDKFQIDVEEEIGDLLFAVVNLARHYKVDPDLALMKANNKFERRFRGVEDLAKMSGHQISEMSLDEMEILWREIKSQEKDNANQ